MALRFDGSDARLVTQTQWIHEWVHQLSAEGFLIADASRGKASYPADREAIAAMQAHLAEVAENVAAYGTHAFGEAPLREQAAAALSRLYAIEFSPANIVFTPGGQFGLSLAFQAVKEACPNGVIVTPCPYYLNHHELAGFMDAEGQAKFLPIKLEESEEFRLSAEKLDEALANYQGEITAFLFCNPANPSGQVVRYPEWQAIAKILRRYPQTPIMLDEAFAEIVFDSDLHCSLLHAAPDLLPRCFLFRSGTKALGLSGERLAVMTIPQKFTPFFLMRQSRLLGNPALSLQAGMTAALESMNDKKISRLSHYYAANAARIEQALQPFASHLSWIKPAGGFYFLLKLSALFGQPMPDKAKRILQTEDTLICDDIALALSLLCGLGQPAGAGLAVVPGSCFGLPKDQGFVRISFSPSEAEITAIISRLEALGRFICA